MRIEARLQRGDIERRREQEALEHVAAGLRQEGALGRRLDALGDRLQMQRAAHLHDRADDADIASSSGRPLTRLRSIFRLAIGKRLR